MARRPLPRYAQRAIERRRPIEVAIASRPELAREVLMTRLAEIISNPLKYVHAARDGKITDVKGVPDNELLLRALHQLFTLQGDYAPQQVETMSTVRVEEVQEIALRLESEPLEALLAAAGLDEPLEIEASPEPEPLGLPAHPEPADA